MYQPEFKTDITRDGTTRTVEMVLHPGERGELLRQITAIKGSQFSLRRLRPGEARPRSGLDGLHVAPAFLPGDSDIRITVDPAVGFTEFLNLKILDPVVVSVAEDWRVLADREGVRATLFRGSVGQSNCFHALGGDGQTFNLNISEDLTADGSWPWPTGDKLYCDVTLKGADGELFVTRKVTEAGRSMIVFVHELQGKHP